VKESNFFHSNILFFILKCFPTLSVSLYRVSSYRCLKILIHFERKEVRGMCQQYKEQKSRWKMGKQEFILLLKLIIAFNCFVFLQIIVIETYSRYLTIIEIDKIFVYIQNQLKFVILFFEQMFGCHTCE
jgi:hypothetical protein